MKTKCRDFSLDLMHFSTDEFKEIEDLADLKTHLKACPDCQKRLKELREAHLFSVVSRPHSARYHKKMASLIKQVRTESAAHNNKRLTRQNKRKKRTLPARTGKGTSPI